MRGKVLREADQEREDVLADALRVRSGRVHDLDSPLGRRVDVNLVITHAVPADDPQVLAPVQQ